MDKKSLLKEFSYRLEKVRKTLGYSGRAMSDFFGVNPVNYARYENGKMFPGFMALHRFAKATGISLDWFVCNREPMYYQEKEEIAKAVLTEDAEIEEMLEHARRIPLLRHELLVGFYKFKEEHKEMTAAANVERV